MNFYYHYPIYPYGYGSFDYYPDYYYTYPEVVAPISVLPPYLAPDPNYYPPGRYYPEAKYYEPAEEASRTLNRGIGWDFLRMGQVEQALSAFKLQAGENPGWGAPLIGQAFSYLELENPQAAANFFSHAPRK